MAANTRLTEAPLRIDPDSLEKFFACHKTILTESGLRVNFRSLLDERFCMREPRPAGDLLCHLPERSRLIDCGLLASASKLQLHTAKSSRRNFADFAVFPDDHRQSAAA